MPCTLPKFQDTSKNRVQALTLIPLTGGRLNVQKYPSLVKVVAAYLAIPATQARSETLISAAGTKLLLSRGKD